MARAYHKTIRNPVTGKCYYLVSDEKRLVDKAARRVKGLWGQAKKGR